MFVHLLHTACDGTFCLLPRGHLNSLRKEQLLEEGTSFITVDWGQKIQNAVSLILFSLWSSFPSSQQLWIGLHLRMDKPPLHILLLTTTTLKIHINHHNKSLDKSADVLNFPIEKGLGRTYQRVHAFGQYSRRRCTYIETSIPISR